MRAVHAVEIDPGARGPPAQDRRGAGAAFANRLTVTTADALAVRAGDLPEPAPTGLVANLPYNVAVPVVLHLLAELPGLRRGLVTFAAHMPANDPSGHATFYP